MKQPMQLSGHTTDIVVKHSACYDRDRAFSCLIIFRMTGLLNPS